MGIDVRFFSWTINKFIQGIQNTLGFVFGGFLGLFSKNNKPLGLGVKFEDEPDQTKGFKNLQANKATSFQTEKISADKKVSNIFEKVNYLKAMSPTSPDFLGSEIEYPQKKGLVFFRSRIVPDLDQLRDEVDKFAEATKVTDPRKKIRKYLRIQPYNPELRALSGIQLFNDTMQSGLEEKKLNALYTALVEVANAVHNWGISIFNVTWLIKIYMKYLELLQKRISTEYDSLSRSFHWQVRQGADDILRELLQVTAMISVKEHLTGLMNLNAKLKGSAFTYGSITQEEIREACSTLVNEGNKTIATGKTANYIVWVIITMASLFARIPMFRKLVAEILRTIPDASRELILQKNMVGTVVSVADYQYAIAIGNVDNIVESAHKLYNRCIEVIEQQINYTDLSKPYEVDPFLKAAWIAKEGDGLFELNEYEDMLKESIRLLSIVIENNDQVKGSFDLARQLQDDIEEIMAKYGWDSYTPTDS